MKAKFKKKIKKIMNQSFQYICMNKFKNNIIMKSSNILEN